MLLFDSAKRVNFVFAVSSIDIPAFREEFSYTRALYLPITAREGKMDRQVRISTEI
jgi:hypothetical protein